MLHLNADPLPWLLENDRENPSVRYFALRDLLDLPEDAPEMRRARKAIMVAGPVPCILAAQQPEGNWVPQGGRYQSTASQIIILSDLGVDPRNKRVRLGCEYSLQHFIASNHAFVHFSQPPVPSKAVHCDSGPLAYALIQLGLGDDQRVRAALEWQAGAVIGKLPSGRYYRSTTAGPEFACGVNQGQPCAWGATKAVRALVAVPKNRRSQTMRQAINVGTDFLLSHDLATADYPHTERISSAWFKFGFPLSYWSDILETAEVLVDSGFGGDSRLARVFQLILNKQDEHGRWRLENSLNGKMWVDIEAKGEPSKWITLRVLRVLKRAGKALVYGSSG